MKIQVETERNPTFLDPTASPKPSAYLGDALALNLKHPKGFYDCKKCNHHLFDKAFEVQVEDTESRVSLQLEIIPMNAWFHFI